MTLDPTIDPLYGVEQVAEMFGVQGYTVRNWIETGKMEAKKIQGRWRIAKSEIVRFANEEHG
jgi:excisionase family DNA binding protein